MADRPGSADALLIVDPQVDFCPGGALAVPGGDRIFGAVQRAGTLIPRVVASRDWHPSDHVSFAARGGPWPPHCVQDTPGAAFHPDLDTAPLRRVFSKGTDPDREAYSAFDATDLAGWLRAEGVKRLYVAGLATDYCVLASTLDARGHGFEVVVLEDAIGAVEVQAGDGERALHRMREAGATVARTADLG
ncbi:MAG: nicotinamidase [Candidatus Dormibacteraeota bacterium]|nr:nicotinamidase [Candidatus Dormibacteraeota bacterium]